jgi:hypothetical protein
MPRRCSVCFSPWRNEVDALLRGGRSCAETGRLAGFSDDAIERHARNHLREKDSVASPERTEFADLWRKIERLSDIAADRGDVKAAVALVQQKLKLIELQRSAPPTIAEGKLVAVGTVAWFDSIIEWHDEHMGHEQERVGNSVAN